MGDRAGVAGASWHGDGLLESGFGSPTAAAQVSWDAHVRRMLQVEVALARAVADVGLIDAAAADAVARACDPARLDLGGLAGQTATSVTPVIPLLAAIRTAAAGTPEADDVAAALHLGATSQDIIDTAAVLCTAEVLEHLDGVLMALADSCARLAEAHRHTVAPGRTLGQQAVPITAGLRAARWMAAVDRRLRHLRTARTAVATLQLGGAAGTLAAFDGHGAAVAQRLGARLGLAVPDLPWHAERDRIVDLAGSLAGVATTVAGIAGDVVALAATEVGEVHPSAGEGTGSSAMPHKRNPAAAVAARAAARLAIGEVTVLLHAAGEHEHERAAGAWQAEWVAVRSALVRTCGAAERTADAVAGLVIDPDRGQRNLSDVGLGLAGAEALAGALATTLGRRVAADLVSDLAQTASSKGRRLHDVAAADPRVQDALPAGALAEVLGPQHALREVDALIDSALATHRSLGQPTTTPELHP